MGRQRLTAEQLARGRQIGAPLGGQAVREKTPPDMCPRCGRSMMGKTWHVWLGHLGLHGLADRFFQGDIEACQVRLRRNGRARQIENPWNGTGPYRPVGGEGAAQRELER